MIAASTIALSARIPHVERGRCSDVTLQPMVASLLMYPVPDA
jgi:hypothetical protein